MRDRAVVGSASRSAASPAEASKCRPAAFGADLHHCLRRGPWRVQDRVDRAV